MNDPIAGFFRASPSPPVQPELGTKENPVKLRQYQMQIGTGLTKNRSHLSNFLEKYPFSWITSGRFSPSDIGQVRDNPGARHWTEQALEQNSIMERNYGLASTTPVLGQYAPTYGWPDDWGWYWEYLDAYLFVPEVEFAVNLKNRQIWKPGFHFEGSNESKVKKVQKEFDRLKIFDTLYESTKSALIEGNDYILSQDDSDAKWQDSSPGDSAQGAAYTNITGAPRPLVKYTEAKRFYGLGNTDPRTWRVQVHPQRWDDNRHQWLVEKYIQRRWAGPLAPNYVLGSQTELDFHPDQCFHLAFHKIFGGIYGYSTFRETLFVLKGYLLMIQFLPQIVEHRADPLLDIAIGGEMIGPGGLKNTWLPNEKDFELVKSRLAARMPGEDLFHDAMTKVEEVYKGRGEAERIDEYITLYKERILLGLGIPMAAATFSGGGEIKFGTLQFDIMDDETRENQQKVASLINDWVTPKLMLNLGHELGDGPDIELALVPPGESAKR